MNTQGRPVPTVGDPMGSTESALWDCHAHLFGPYGQYPLAADRSYTPPEAPLAAYLSLLDRLGCTHGVLVHPSAYGGDHRLLLDALAAAPQLRGVVVGGAEAPLAWSTLHRQGVRAARFSHRSGAGANFAGSASWDDLLALAPRLADGGLHAELWTDAQALPALAPRLGQLPVPVVIDHMGGFDAAAGPQGPGFQALLQALDSGRVWVKLCAYRNLLSAPDPEVGAGFVQALLACRPDRLVWGSDWPHLRVSPEPDAADLLATVSRWVGDAARMQSILHHNPQALYG